VYAAVRPVKYHYGFHGLSRVGPGKKELENIVMQPTAYIVYRMIGIKKGLNELF